jgi:glycosyltransferase involved in cell wall biosynthesis
MLVGDKYYFLEEKFLPDKPYRLLFLGNSNCMPFNYAYLMKKKGHQVSFYVDASPSETLHRPEAFFPEISYPYPNWIKELGWRPRGIEFLYLSRRLRSLIQSLWLQKWDGIILSGFWIKIAPFLDTKSFIMLFAGSDLSILPNYRHILKTRYCNSFCKNILIKFSLLLGAILQRKGIKKSTLVNYYPEGIDPDGDKILTEILRDKKYQRLQMRGLDITDYEYKSPRNRIGKKVRVFCGQRFIWKQPFPRGYSLSENKGNDKMIRGLANFYQRTKVDFEINFVEKGIHVAESKDLARRLGISHLIKWHKPMTNIEIQKYYEDSDIVFDQFANHIIGRGAIDAMLMGRPVIGNARDDIFKKVLGEPIAMCNATNEKEISRWLEILVFDLEERHKIGLKGRNSIIKHFNGKDTVAELLNHIDGNFV